MAAYALILIAAGMIHTFAAVTAQPWEVLALLLGLQLTIVLAMIEHARRY